jgi:hypothetical protein
MPTPTYDLIATTTLAAASPEVVFGSIPQGYRDLILVMNPVIAALTIPTYRVNGLTTSIYSHVGAVGYSGGTPSYSGTEDSGRLQQQQSAQIGQVVYTVQFMDYSATDKHKTALVRQSQSNGDESMTAGRVATTSAITSIAVSSGANNFQATSTFSIYGVIS